MYDPNTHLRERTFLDDPAPTTWQDVARQCRDYDVDPCLYKVHHESLVFSLVAGLTMGFFRLLSGLLSVPARLMHHKRDDLPLEHHLPASR